MSRDLTNLFIDETFQYLTQISGSNRDILEDGLGNRITELDITASNSISSSHSVTSVSSSYSVTSSYALDNYTAATNTFSDITLTKGDGTTTILDTTPNQMVEKIINRNGFMPKGTPVYVSGSTGDQLNVYGADAGDPNKMPAVFILAQDLDPDEAGLGILSGEITQVDTSAFEDGDEVWVAVGGGYTNQRPTGSNTLVQKLGAVVKAQANGSGVIFGAGRANDVPNIQEGYVWVGDADGVAQPVATASIAPVTSSYALQALSSSYAVTASYALNAGGSGFPFTGSAGISGSLRVHNNNGLDAQFKEDGSTVIGTTNLSANVNSNFTVNAPNNLEFDVNEFGLSVGRFDSGSISMNLLHFGASQPSVQFNGENAYFQATNNMYFENAPGGVGTGDMFFFTNGQLQFQATKQAISFQASQSIELRHTDGDLTIPIDIAGEAFHYTTTTNINGFTNEVNVLSKVRDNQRAFVETPLTIGINGSVEVGTNSTLKVINEL